jgi:hypothetical protein
MHRAGFRKEVRKGQGRCYWNHDKTILLANMRWPHLGWHLHHDDTIAVTRLPRRTSAASCILEVLARDGRRRLRVAPSTYVTVPSNCSQSAFRLLFARCIRGILEGSQEITGHMQLLGS